MRPLAKGLSTPREDSIIDFTRRAILAGAAAARFAPLATTTARAAAPAAGAQAPSFSRYKVGAHCMACHSRASEAVPPDFKTNYSRGGREFRGPWGVAVTANISGSSSKGLGGWSDAEIRRGLTEGMSKDGRKLKPPMIDYIAYYKTWKPEDLDALIAWIRTIPPIE